MENSAVVFSSCSECLCELLVMLNKLIEISLAIWLRAKEDVTQIPKKVYEPILATDLVATIAVNESNSY